MKSYFLVSDGQRLNIELRDVARPEPGPGQLLVKMHAAALNRGELIVGHGLTAPGTAKAAGMEGAGEIVALGADAGNWQIGQNVMGRCAGAFAEYALIDHREAMPVPAALSMVDAAAIPLTYLVAHDLVVLQGGLKEGQWALINGISSGVGVASFQIAKTLGAKVIGTSGSREKLAQLCALGLDHAIQTREANYFDEVMKLTAGKGINLCVNTVGGSVFAESIKCLAFEGRLGFVGYVDGQLDATIDLMALHGKRLTLFGVSNKQRTLAQRTSGVPRFIAEILPAFASGKIKPLIHAQFEFADLPKAVELMESNQQNGKIVVEMAK